LARIAGVDLPRNKRIEIALTYIFGIGHSAAKKVIEISRVDPDIRVNNLTDEQVASLRNVIEQNYKVEGALRTEYNMNIKRLRKTWLNLLKGERPKRKQRESIQTESFI